MFLLKESYYISFCVFRLVLLGRVFCSEGNVLRFRCLMRLWELEVVFLVMLFICNVNRLSGVFKYNVIFIY